MPAAGVREVFLPEIDPGFVLDFLPDSGRIEGNIGQVDLCGLCAFVPVEFADQVALGVVARNAHQITGLHLTNDLLSGVHLGLAQEAVHLAWYAACGVHGINAYGVTVAQGLRFGFDLAPVAIICEVDRCQIERNRRIRADTTVELVNSTVIGAYLLAVVQRDLTVFGQIVPLLTGRAGIGGLLVGVGQTVDGLRRDASLESIGKRKFTQFHAAGGRAHVERGRAGGESRATDVREDIRINAVECERKPDRHRNPGLSRQGRRERRRACYRVDRGTAVGVYRDRIRGDRAR